MFRLALGLVVLAWFAGTAWAVEVPDALPVRAPADSTAFRLSSPCATPCAPQPAPCCSPCVPCPQWHAGIYGWFSWIDSDMTVRDRDADLSATPSDLLENLNGLFIGTAGVRWDRWSLEGALLYTKLENNDVSGPDTQVGPPEEASLTQWIAQATVGYACAAWSGGSCPGNCMTFIGEVGLRYVSYELSVDFARDGFDKTVDWLDPIVGGRVVWDINPKWNALVAANVGGFGVGTDFSAEIRLGVEYRMAKWIGLVVGFEALYFDYDDEFEMQQWTYGPTIGLEFHW